MPALTSKRQLKRLSLLEASAANSISGSPRKVDVPDSADIQTSSTSLPSAQFTPSPTSSSSSPAGTAAVNVKSSRRQSTICYISRDSQELSPPTHSHELPIIEGRKETEEDRKELQDNSSPLRERTAVTLAEKHADLLRFIAQKESKCLELRSQLQVHEAELLALKRKWERIVSRGFTGTPPPTASIQATSDASDASPQAAAVMNGLKESMQGVGRFIAGLSDNISIVQPFHEQDTLPLQTKERGADHESTSSISTSYTENSSVRFSQSSMSSFEGVGDVDDDAQPHKIAGLTGIPPVDSAMVDVLSAVSSPRASDKLVRRRSAQSRTFHVKRDSTPSSPQSPVSTPLTPSAMSSSQGQSRTSHPRPNAPSRSSFPPPSSIPGLSALSIASSGPTSPSPFSTWVDTMGKSMGKKLGQIQGGKVHKRASTLLSEASNSLFAVLAPQSPTVSTTNTPAASDTSISPSLTSSTGSSSTRNVRSESGVPLPPISASVASCAKQRTKISLMDDDEDDALSGDSQASSSLVGVVALLPDKASHLSIRSKPSDVASSQQEMKDKAFDDDEWNW